MQFYLDDFDENEGITYYYLVPSMSGLTEEMIKIAQKEDGTQNYRSDCFCVSVTIDEKGNPQIFQKEKGWQLYYVNCRGDLIWINHVFTKEDQVKIIEACKKN